MTREECELSIVYLEGIKDNYIDGNGYERHPLPEYYAIETAIKALDQKPETVTEFADRCRECGAKYGKALEQTRWIPVGERLPEDFQDVLVWYEYFRYGDYNRMVQTYGIGCYISNLGAWSGDPGTGTMSKVFAWMPLPEPYKAESEE